MMVTFIWQKPTCVNMYENITWMMPWKCEYNWVGNCNMGFWKKS